MSIPKMEVVQVDLSDTTPDLFNRVQTMESSCPMQPLMEPTNMEPDGPVVIAVQKTGTDYITDCHIGGKIGDYSIYKNNPEDTPVATYNNAVRHGAFSKEANNFSNQDEAYYDWQVTEDRELASGIVYKHYSFTNFNQNIYAIEIDMNNPESDVRDSHGR